MANVFGIAGEYKKEHECNGGELDDIHPIHSCSRISLNDEMTTHLTPTAAQ